MTYYHCHRLCLLLSFGLFATLSATLEASPLDTEPTVTFTKTSNADPTLEENQDRISDQVWITRDATKGIYNAAIEGGYTQFTSPLGTEWAMGTTDDDLSSLDFGTWYEAVENRPPLAIDKDLVLYIPADKAYYNIRFTEWGGPGSGGSYSYLRSLNPVIIPEPSSIAMIALAGAALVGWRARKR